MTSYWRIRGRGGGASHCLGHICFFFMQLLWKILQNNRLVPTFTFDTHSWICHCCPTLAREKALSCLGWTFCYFTDKITKYISLIFYNMRLKQQTNTSSKINRFMASCIQTFALDRKIENDAEFSGTLLHCSPTHMHGPKVPCRCPLHT